MATIVNNYFVSFGKKLASIIPPPNISAYPVVCSGPGQSFVLHDTFTEEVSAVINSLIESKSTGQNDIPIHILKLSKNVLSSFIEPIFNICIKEGIYPQSLKCAEVVPIHKGGQKDVCTNYRPIPLLSPINNIFEKLICKRLYSYIEQNKMFSTDQYGFRSGMSTSLAVYDMHENLLQSAKDGFTTSPVFCDLSKAFDTIDASN